MPSAEFLRHLDAVRRKSAATDAAIQRDVASVRVPGLPGIDPWLTAIIIGDLLARSSPDRAEKLRRLPLARWVPLVRAQLVHYADEAKRHLGAPETPSAGVVPLTTLPPIQLPPAPSFSTPSTVVPQVVRQLPQPTAELLPEALRAIALPTPSGVLDGVLVAPLSRPEPIAEERRAEPLPTVEERRAATDQAPRGPAPLPPAPAAPSTPSGAIIPLPPPGLPEPLREAWIQARTRAGDYCRGLGDVIRQWPEDVAREAWSGENIAEEVNAELRRQKRDIIKVATAEAVAKIWTPERLASELGHKTGEWSRNWLRVARTELQGANNEGVAIEAMRAFGAEARVARVPESGACQSCKDVYTKDGLPIVFTVTELLANGTNVGRKEKDRRATLFPNHPSCFAANTGIYTPSGERPIQGIMPGDVVLSGDGTWQRVDSTWTSVGTGGATALSVDGRALAVTDGHPIRTDDGWKDAGSLKAGDQVVCLSVNDRVVLDGDAQNRPPERRQGLGFASIVSGLSRGGVPVTAVYFDGNLVLWECDVDIQGLDGVARLRAVTGLGESVDDRLLVAGENLARVDVGAMDECSLGALAPSDCIMGASGPAVPLLGRGLGHANSLGLLAVAGLHATRDDSLDDPLAPGPGLGGYFLYRQETVEVESAGDGWCQLRVGIRVERVGRDDGRSRWRLHLLGRGVGLPIAGSPSLDARAFQPVSDRTPTDANFRSDLLASLPAPVSGDDVSVGHGDFMAPSPRSVLLQDTADSVLGDTMPGRDDFHGVSVGGVVGEDGVSVGLHSGMVHHTVIVDNAVRVETPSLVYNLTVSGEGTYVANGVVVHNCRCSTMTVPPGTTITHDGTIVGRR